jgi:hypothetical protein
MGNVSNTWVLVALTAVGVYVGAMAQGKFMPKGAPTASTVK